MKILTVILVIALAVIIARNYLFSFAPKARAITRIPALCLI